ncbi:MAG: 2-amino-4-hydroxy-6-hydroxymethyldihydropteridine diphosphokinase [Candidatus Omnitrophica bacterium]|nr:2-amino-4-hydroxy-6-hydroxymethyldihydropteridine diphosphokinase [Candidatus Omnitrophota bacterium]
MPKRRSTTAYVGIGSNLGDRKSNIEKAIRLVELVKGVRLKNISSIYETDPAGGPKQGKFLNGVFKIETTLNPLELLCEFQKIEKHLGRKKRIKNAPRTIDLDILLFGSKKIDDKKLTIPHPRMHKREFVLKGLRELRQARML